MAGLPEKLEKRTDALDGLGNTTAATGKGLLLLVSAALTAFGSCCCIYGGGKTLAWKTS